MPSRRSRMTTLNSTQIELLYQLKELEQIANIQ